MSRASVTGYDGNGYSVGDRVELHPGSTLWMRGAKYGTVLKLPSAHRMGGDRVHVRSDHKGMILRWSAGNFRFVGSTP